MVHRALSDKTYLLLALLSPLKFLLILILNNLVDYYIFPLGKTAMHRLKLSILFATLGQLAAKILVIL